MLLANRIIIIILLCVEPLKKEIVMAFGKGYDKGYNKGYQDAKKRKPKVNFGHAVAAFPNILDPTESPDEFEKGYQEGYKWGAYDREGANSY